MRALIGSVGIHIPKSGGNGIGRARIGTHLIEGRATGGCDGDEGCSSSVTGCAHLAYFLIVRRLPKFQGSQLIETRVDPGKGTLSGRCFAVKPSWRLKAPGLQGGGGSLPVKAAIGLKAVRIDGAHDFVHRIPRRTVRMLAQNGLHVRGHGKLRRHFIRGQAHSSW